MYAGGLIYTRAWNNLQYVVGASFLMTVYSDYLSKSNKEMVCPAGHVGSTELFDMAKSQVELASSSMYISIMRTI